MAARTEGALRHFLEHVVATDGFDVFFFAFLAVFIVLFVVTGGFRSLAMRRLCRFASGVNGIGRLGDRGHDFGKRFTMGFDDGGIVRFGNALGRNGRGRLVGMMVVLVMIMLVVMTMIVMIVRVLVIMGVGMIMVIVIIMLMIVMAVIIVMMDVVVAFVLAVMLGIGMQVLALMRRAFGVLLMGLALDRLGRGIATSVETLDDVATDALALTAAAGIAVARTAAAVGAVLTLFLGFAMGLFFGLDQRLPVGDGDLVIVGMDFAEGEEAVAIAAIFNEGGLK
ncbi:hypothetical protein [uncultured Bradyrhizobium sp.]|uniref:hypothetical protein n=1 Tax=uncultured Bradyrhizobium sp. TaxID=199684 RepID=UPI002621808D|nr:hypothetical protein [uncultured Bradyrhizobium sp.]